jgi:hypothetical protein
VIMKLSEKAWLNSTFNKLSSISRAAWVKAMTTSANTEFSVSQLKVKW